MKVSLTAIRAFDALVRTSSFKKAADSLNVTPTAVSHQIKLLEEHLGRQLFVRSTRSVSLSEEGVALSMEICPALQTIRDAIDKRLRQPVVRTVSVGLSSLFASRWFIPRLGAFLQDHPDIDLALHHSVLPVWQQAERYDLCIEWGAGNWEGLDATRLYTVQFSPVAAPALIAGRGKSLDAQALSQEPLLHYRSTSAWKAWFQANGVIAVEEIRGVILEDANVELQAALEGKGFSLGIFPLIDAEVQAGKLVRPLSDFYQPNEGYYLIEQKSLHTEPHVQAVRNWLKQNAATE